MDTPEVIPMRVLVVEDEVRLAATLQDLLELNGYTVDICHDGESGLDNALTAIYDVILLDVMLPKLDGFTVLRRLRAEHSTTPVLMLTARSDLSDRVQGLDCGADYYLTKPFDMRELLARLRVLTRKNDVQQTNILICGNTSLNTRFFELSAPGGSYKLASKEYQTMLFLMRNPGIVLSSAQFLDNIWDVDSRAGENTVWTYISYLRRKLEAIASNLQIRTMRGAGYVLEVRQ